MKSKMEVHVIMRLGIQFLLFYMYASIWLSASFLELFSSEGGGGLAPVTDQSSSFPKETPFRASIAHFLDNSLPSQDSFIFITTGPPLLLQLIYFQWIHV